MTTPPDAVPPVSVPPDDDRRRVLANLAAAVAALLAAGIWLVDALIDQSRREDCLLAHRRHCPGVETPVPGAG